MALNELWWEVLLVCLCINGGILITDSLIPTPLISPFDTSANVTGLTSGPVTDTYNFTDTSGTLGGNLTSGQLQNNTIGGAVGFLTPIDFIFQPLAFLWSVIIFMTSGFAINMVQLLGFPDIFIYVMTGIFGLLLVRNVLYLWTGR